ncbi:hypothetical protein HY624_02710 [Candidatus Uhrbacteria bacterium]|nr:hypothetical protein [Candidatus Uhrbacteria bacterium]
MGNVFRRKIVLATLLLGALFLLPTVFLSAAEGAKITDNLWALRDTVIVAQPVAGDVIVAAETLEIRAPVRGDVIALARTILIDAPVGGSVRVVGETVTIRGSIGRALTVIGNTLTVEKQATIGEYTWASVSQLNAEGTFKGPVMTPEKSEPVPYLTMITSPSFLFTRLIMLFGLYIVGLVLIMLARRPTAMTMSCMLSEPLKNMSWGMLGLIVTPIMCLILFGTVIGIPLALLTIVFWAAMVYCAHVLAALAIGFAIMHRIDPHHHFHSIMWTLVVGGIVWTILTHIPVLGWFIELMGIIWALGACMQVLRLILSELNEQPQDGKS